MKTTFSKSLRRISMFWVVLCACAATWVAADQFTDFAMVPRLTIQGTIGATNQIQYCTTLSPPNWVVLTNVVVAQSPYWFVDVNAPPAPRRFYRLLTFTNNTAPTGMVLIPAGSFTMGDSFSEYEADELPLHDVYVSAFYMDKYEVTMALWDEVYNWATAHGYSFDNSGLGKAAAHPVQTVSWYDAVKWCNARSEKEGREPAYYTDAGQTNVYRGGQTNLQNDWVKWDRGYRLPTEAEREKAGRGGVSGHRFPWGDVNTITHSRANYYSSTSLVYDVSPTQWWHPTFNAGGYPYTSPAGYFAPNGYGLYDMAGNVWEWCWDWYSDTYYSSSPGSDPRGPASGPGRVLRGGCWNNTAVGCRSADRNLYGPSTRLNILGFRSVLLLAQ